VSFTENFKKSKRKPLLKIYFGSFPFPQVKTFKIAFREREPLVYIKYFTLTKEFKQYVVKNNELLQ
jgi:hypothetical protein